MRTSDWSPAVCSSDLTGLRDDQFESISSSSRYDHWLPGLHLRYQLTDDTMIRAAWTNSVVRPTYGQLAPGSVIDGNDAEFGNPDLKRSEERRVGKECVSTCRSLWSPDLQKKTRHKSDIHDI